MSQLPERRSESAFSDFKAAYGPSQATAEANRCLYCFDAPCIRACPTGIDIPTFIRKIATGNVRGSAKTIFDANILGMSCARVCPVEVLCVGDCVYNQLDSPPIQIGKLQRYATDAAFDAGWTFYEAGPDTGRSVGLIGAGPATLACAHRLRRFGHRCTIYEKRAVVGGLNTTGVAPYKLRADDALREAQWVLDIGGVAIEHGVEVPATLGWDVLRARHDALFLGFGLGPDSVLEGEGADLEGVVGGVEWVEAMKLGTVDLSAVREAVVLGGGNTSVDCVRELLGLGVARVSLVYRGGEPTMPGYAHEWAAAKQEGARGVWFTSPIGFAAAASGRVGGVRCLRTDADKRPLPGTEHTLQADLVVVAIGQAKLASLTAGLPGLVTDKGRIVTDAGGATGCAGVWAGGDCVNGGKEVVNAVAMGRDAALSIHAYLNHGGA